MASLEFSLHHLQHLYDVSCISSRGKIFVAHLLPKEKKIVAHLSLLTNLLIWINLSGSAEGITNSGFSLFELNDPNENAAFLSFGSGTRACVGQKYVIQVVATLLASLLKKYEVQSVFLLFLILLRENH